MLMPRFSGPSAADLEKVFVQKYGEPSQAGWSPRRRWRLGYWPPADVYEATVAGHVKEGDRWLDVGGGHSIFPTNPSLARDLVDRCSRVVAVDPSDNVLKNPFVHERIQSFLEEFRSDTSFDLVTMRMVVEHVGAPQSFVAALSRLVEPGGLAIVLTVNRWSPISIVSKLVPFGLHHAVKHYFWGGVEEDTFPVHYRMNTHHDLRGVFESNHFQEAAFMRLDDLSAFGQFKLMGAIELKVWQAMSSLGLRYPEHNFLAVYRRLPG